MGCFFDSLLSRGQDYQLYKNQILVADSRIVFGETKTADTVAVLGTIKNTSAVSWQDIAFHVDFFDAAGKLTDVGAKEVGQYCLPAGETSAFKVSFTREFPESNYAKATVRVDGAKDIRARF
jgi:hypothetical protein